MDVISQGREPERDSRPPWSRRRRAAIATAVIVVAAAVLTVTGMRLRHGAGAPAASASATPAPAAPADVTAPADQPGLVLCSPSTRACSVRIVVGKAWHVTVPRNASTGRLA